MANIANHAQRAKAGNTATNVIPFPHFYVPSGYFLKPTTITPVDQRQQCPHCEQDQAMYVFHWYMRSVCGDGVAVECKVFPDLAYSVCCPKKGCISLARMKARENLKEAFFYYS